MCVVEVLRLSNVRFPGTISLPNNGGGTGYVIECMRTARERALLIAQALLQAVRSHLNVPCGAQRGTERPPFLVCAATHVSSLGALHRL